ncbi:MAG: hypothetical protein HYW47_01675 [Deltaproteobacteria bacterium]|nr:hypothetical protein [Deltaproteobacteria bacterium]
MKDQYKLQAEVLVQGISSLPLTVMTIGEKDFTFGKDFLIEQVKKFHLPVVSSNVYEKGTRKLLFEDHKIVTVRGKRLGIFALTEPFHFKFLATQEVDVTDPIPIAQKMIKKLVNDKVDYIIVLSDLGILRETKLASQVEGIDIIIGGHSEDVLQQPRMIKNTLIVQAGYQGHYIGNLTVFSEVQKKIYNHELVALDTHFEPGTPFMRKLVSDFKEKLEKHETVPEKTQKNGKVPQGYETSSYCVQCHTKQTEVWKNSHHSTAFLSLYVRNQHFNNECISCHTVGFHKEGGFTDVRKAVVKNDGTFLDLSQLADTMILETQELNQDLKKLLKKNIAQFKEAIKATQEKDKKSLYEGQIFALQKIEETKSLKGSMLSFYENPEIYNFLRKLYIKELDKTKLAKNYWGVQCENCHGGRAGHPFEKGDFSKKVGTKACATCHNKENSPRFNLEEFHRVQGIHKSGKFAFICAEGKP